MDEKVQLDQIYELIRRALREGIPEEAIDAEVESAERAHRSLWHIESTPQGIVICDNSIPRNEIRLSDGRQVVRIFDLGIPNG